VTTTTAASTSWTWLRSLGAVALVLGVAAVTGTLTPFGEIHLPRSINAAANSSGPWAMIAFASVYLSRARGAFAATLGACSLVVMDLFFFVAFELRVGHYLHSYLAFWLTIAILVGPLVGLCASWLRSRRMSLRAISIAAPSSVLVGEGIFMLVRLPGVSTVYAVASVVVGVLLFAILSALRLRGMRWIVMSAAMCGVAAVAFYAVYGLLPLVLDKVVP
jgi:Family of unknown function (DUF6518)